jgi:hypothetical protein
VRHVRKRHILAAVAGAVLVVGSVYLVQPQACHAHLPKADAGCTPGLADPAVTQQNIRSTICVSGYTATVRPPAAYTDTLKLAQMKQYGFVGNPSDFEEDHLIALELGGDPRDPRNLWPQPRRSINGLAESKDQQENALHRAVCNGTLTLTAAQAQLQADWTGR